MLARRAIERHASKKGLGLSACLLRFTRLLAPSGVHPLTSGSCVGVQPDDPRDIVDDNLGFSKDRCVSRLTEMQSLPYLTAHARKHSPNLLLALEEAAQKADAAKAPEDSAPEPEKLSMEHAHAMAMAATA